MNDQKRSHDIQKIVLDRRIEILGHFTPFENLASIVQCGMLPGRYATELVLDRMYCPDPNRIDDPDGTRGRPLCFSVSSINQSLIEAKKRLYPDQEWAFLSVPSSIMWTHWCEFFHTNAAKKEFRRPNKNFWRPYYLEAMFGGNRAGMPDFLPTFADAEVQVFEPISPDLIIEIWVETEKAAAIARKILACIPGDTRTVGVGMLHTLCDERMNTPSI